jgi:hypothetical protein
VRGAPARPASPTRPAPKSTELDQRPNSISQPHPTTEAKQKAVNENQPPSLPIPRSQLGSPSPSVSKPPRPSSAGSPRRLSTHGPQPGSCKTSFNSPSFLLLCPKKTSLSESAGVADPRTPGWDQEPRVMRSCEGFGADGRSWRSWGSRQGGKSGGLERIGPADGGRGARPAARAAV